MTLGGPGVSARVVESPTSVTLVLGGEIDRTSIAAVTAAIDQLLASRPPHVEVDLGAVTFFGSEGVHALGEIRNACAASGRRLVLRNVPKLVTRVLELTGTLGYFSVADG